jgi:hypothetical protein
MPGTLGNVLTSLYFSVSLAVIGCGHTNESAAPVAKQPESRVTDKWMGRWNGPEGTYLVLSRNGHKVSILIKDLDNVKNYQGTAAADSIAFVRDGKTETIRAGNGEQTGMKWLADKKDCLVIRTGDGYCRD